MVTYLAVLAGVLIGYTAAVIFLPTAPGRDPHWARVAIAIAGGVVGWVFAGASGGASLVWAEEVVPVTAPADFERLRTESTEEPVLVAFYADWCPPCRQTAPGVNALARAGHRVAVVNVDRNESLSREHGVQAIPTLMVLRDGKVAIRAMGYHSEDELRDLLSHEPERPE